MLRYKETRLHFSERLLSLESLRPTHLTQNNAFCDQNKKKVLTLTRPAKSHGLVRSETKQKMNENKKKCHG